MNPHEIDSLDTLRLRIREFAQAREWERYHTPKNLVMALSVEAAELLEPFQWLTAEQSQHLSADQHEAVRQEIADVLIYLTRLADLLDIDLLNAAADKLALNARKYPVGDSHSNALKHRTSRMTDLYYKHHVFFCTNVREDGAKCCGASGGQYMRDYLKKKVKHAHLNGEGKCRINSAGCLDRCDEGPLLVVYPEGVWYTYVDEADIDEIFEVHLKQGRIVERLQLK